tara:strand:- start:2377 stop:2877 length:501 start_codon:yes stop_codon:yes gene_type:complete
MAFDGNNYMCTSFKKELLEAVHNFKLSGGSAFQIALYTNSAAGNNGFGGTSTDMDETITNYSANNEVANGNGYTTKGEPLTRIDPTTGQAAGGSPATTAYTSFQSSSAVWQSSTITARGALIFNDTASNDAAVIVLDFGSDKSSSSGDFKVVFPTAAAGSAIIRIA